MEKSKGTALCSRDVTGGLGICGVIEGRTEAHGW